jgi:hypothetical protein
MLAVKRRVHLAREQILEGEDRHFGETEAFFDRLHDAHLPGFIDHAACHGRGLHLDLGWPLAEQDARFTATATLDAVGAGAPDVGFDGIRDAAQRSIDIGKAFCAVLDRQIGQIDIDRQARQIAVEKIDGRAALEGEARLLRHEWERGDQQLDLILVHLSRH